MWIAVDTSSNSAVVILCAALIGAAGSIIASYLVIRKQNRQGEGATRHRADKPRRRVRPSERLTRIESWKEQYADPLLHRIANVLDWPDNEPP